MSKHRRRSGSGPAAEAGVPARPDGSLVEVAVYGVLGAVVAGAVMAASGMPWWQAAMLPAVAVVLAGVVLLLWSASRTRASVRSAEEADQAARRGRRRRT